MPLGAHRCCWLSNLRAKCSYASRRLFNFRFVTKENKIVMLWVVCGSKSGLAISMDAFFSIPGAVFSAGGIVAHDIGLHLGTPKQKDLEPSSTQDYSTKIATHAGHPPLHRLCVDLNHRSQTPSLPKAPF